MRTVISMLMLATVLTPATSRADATADKVFASNEGKGMAGWNSISQTECSVLVKGHTLYYLYDHGGLASLDGNDDPFRDGLMPNGVSKNEFRKDALGRRLITQNCEGLACWIGAKYLEGSMQITYNTQGRLKTIESRFNGRLQDICEF